MSNIIRFPGGPASPYETSSLRGTRIPRERFAALAGLALDVVDQILVLLDDESAPSSEIERGVGGPGRPGPDD